MKPNLTRRSLLAKAAAGFSLACLPGPLIRDAAAARANDQLRVAVMGVNGRGASLASAFAQTKAATVAYLCDVDSRTFAKAAKSLAAHQSENPRTIVDFRKALDDNSIDALVVAAPNHWHAPASILACSAGKHVYVEKPCSHTGREGEILVEAATKNKRMVQMGNQRRTWPAWAAGIAALRSGTIGPVNYARCWYASPRGSIGKGKTAPVPEWLNYELWQGPAPDMPYTSNLVHYNWHWFWHWGNGELGNNGVHGIDIARWGLDVAYPIRVSSMGTKLSFPDDDQQTPDTHVVTYDFGGKMLTWEGLSRSPRGLESTGFGVQFLGAKGVLTLTDNGYVIHDLNKKELDKQTGPAGDLDHVKNFIQAIQGNAKLNSPILEGHRSTLLCHLGNIAHRTGVTLICDPATGKPTNNPQAAALWTREYRKGWEPKA